MNRYMVRKVNGEYRIYSSAGWHDTEPTHALAMKWARRYAMADQILNHGRLF